MKFAGRDQLAGDGLCAAERFDGGADHQKIAFQTVVVSVSPRLDESRGNRVELVGAQPRSVTVVLGWRAAVEPVTNFTGDGAAVMVPLLWFAAPFGDRGLGVACRGGRLT